MYIKSLDVSLELRELVEEVLSFLELVLVGPVLEPAVQLRAVEPVLEAHAFQRRRELTRSLQTILQVFDGLIDRNIGFLYQTIAAAYNILEIPDRLLLRVVRSCPIVIERRVLSVKNVFIVL